MPGAKDNFIEYLAAYGFQWDGKITYQSERHPLYREALEQLNNKALLYACDCSRKSIQTTSRLGSCGYIYPDTCREQEKPWQSAAIRIRTHDRSIGLEDPIQGPFYQNLHHDLGDFILQRRDGLFAYQLAVVVDDHHQQMTEVVRGFDILDNTPRQIYLQQQLGYSTPAYVHLPIITNNDGKKLSKQTYATPIHHENALAVLTYCWQALGQQPLPKHLKNIDTFWRYAIDLWDRNRIPKRQTITQSIQQSE